MKHYFFNQSLVGSRYTSTLANFVVKKKVTITFFLKEKSNYNYSYTLATFEKPMLFKK